MSIMFLPSLLGVSLALVIPNKLFITFKLYTVPEAGKAHQMSVLSRHVVRQPLLSVFEPLIKSLSNHDASFASLHAGPHSPR